MAFIKEEEKIALRNQVNIVDIVEDYGVALKKEGKNYKGFCPFHDDHNNPSMVVSPEKQIFNCFTCKEKPSGGDVFVFVMKKLGISYYEAVQVVADKVGFKLSGGNVKKTFESKYKKEYEIYDFATKYYFNNLNTVEGKEAKDYLASRGINEEIIREFNLGLAFDEKDSFYKLAAKKNYDLNDLDNLGLVNKIGANVYDTFINRIVIPIENHSGQVVGFTGRVFHGESIAKYLNTKDTYLYRKGNILFNLHNARSAIKTKGEVILVEGNMDAIKVSAKGIKNVVALMGVALSEENINVLEKLRVKIILMLDSDAAGEGATMSLGNQLLRRNLDIGVVRLSGAKDPDEYIEKYGVEKLEDNIKHAINYLDYKLEVLKQGRDLTKVDDLGNYAKDVIKSIKYVDNIRKGVIISKLANDYGLDKDFLKNELSNTDEVVNFKKNEEKVEEKLEKKRKTKYDIAVNKVLFGMMLSNEYIVIYKNKLGYFKNKIERVIASEIGYYYNTYKRINVADFLSFVMDNEEVYARVLEIVNENINTEMDVLEFEAYVDAVLQELKKDEIKELKEKIRVEMDINKKVELLEKLMEIKKGCVDNERN